MGFRQFRYAALVSIIFLATSCKRQLNEIPGDNVPGVFPIEQQIKIGDKISQAIFNNPTDFPILDKDDPLYENAYSYLQNNILEVIVKSPVMKKWKDFDWKVNIIDLNDERHAFFLPNGEFFIHVDLLKELDNDAELIGLVAHELAYIEGDLLMKNLKTKVGASVLSSLLAEGQVDNPSDMILLEYESNEVLYADSFAVAAICPFSYDSKAPQNLLARFDTVSVGPYNIDWYSRKDNAEYVDRENKIEDFFAEHPECKNSGGVTRKDEYEYFKEQYLP